MTCALHIKGAAGVWTAAERRGDMATGRRVLLASIIFEANSAVEAGSAIFVRGTSGEGVVLTQGTVLLSNTKPSIRVVNGLVSYRLPAPRGRFIDAAGGDSQALSGEIAADLPLACAPGISGRQS